MNTIMLLPLVTTQIAENRWLLLNTTGEPASVMLQHNKKSETRLVPPRRIVEWRIEQRRY